MKVVRLDENNLLLAGLDPFLVELLEKLEVAATLGKDDPARGRFFPDPAAGTEETINEEWRQYVTPELRRLFESAVETVSRDLEGMAPQEDEEEKFGLPVPLDHGDAWLSALNQARLALAERFHVGENDMEARFPFVVVSERDYAILQIHFYGLLQELLIEAIS